MDEEQQDKEKAARLPEVRARRRRKSDIASDENQMLLKRELDRKRALLVTTWITFLVACLVALTALLPALTMRLLDTLKP